MIPGVVIAVGFGLVLLGGSGVMSTSTELQPDRKMVTLFIILFLVGMGLAGGGVGYIS